MRYLHAPVLLLQLAMSVQSACDEDSTAARAGPPALNLTAPRSRRSTVEVTTEQWKECLVQPQCEAKICDECLGPNEKERCPLNPNCKHLCRSHCRCECAGYPPGGTMDSCATEHCTRSCGRRADACLEPCEQDEYCREGCQLEAFKCQCECIQADRAAMFAHIAEMERELDSLDLPTELTMHRWRRCVHQKCLYSCGDCLDDLDCRAMCDGHCACACAGYPWGHMDRRAADRCKRKNDCSNKAIECIKSCPEPPPKVQTPCVESCQLAALRCDCECARRGVPDNYPEGAEPEGEEDATTTAPLTMEQVDACYEQQQCKTATCRECADPADLACSKMCSEHCACGCAGFPPGHWDSGAAGRCRRRGGCLRTFRACCKACEQDDEACTSACKLAYANCKCECMRPDVPDSFPENT